MNMCPRKEAIFHSVYKKRKKHILILIGRRFYLPTSAVWQILIQEYSIYVNVLYYFTDLLYCALLCSYDKDQGGGVGGGLIPAKATEIAEKDS
jgi:hypothetical protein